MLKKYVGIPVQYGPCFIWHLCVSFAMETFQKQDGSNSNMRQRRRHVGPVGQRKDVA